MPENQLQKMIDTMGRILPVWGDSLRRVGVRKLPRKKQLFSDSAGNDSYDGLAQAWDGTHGPWKTLTKVNNTDLSPSDSALFERGGEYRSNIGLDRQDGDASGRITFGAYGNPNAPKPRILSSVENNLYNISWNGGAWYDWTETSPGSHIWTTQPLLDSVLPTGSQLVTNGNFSQSATGWNLIHQNGANATASTTGGFYNLRMRSNAQGGRQGTDWSSIQLYTGVDLVEGEYYLLSFSAKSTQPFTIPTIFIPDDAHVIAGEMPTLTASWQNYQLLFKADATTREWLKFGVGGPDGLPLGSDFSLDNVSFKQCSTPGNKRLIDIDVGNIIFNNGGSAPGGGSWSGMRRWNSVGELVQPGDYHADYATNTVQLYCTQNPATYYNDIEIAVGGGDGVSTGQVIAPGNYTNYENLDVRYGGMDGIRTYYGNTSNVTVRNCDVAYMGGVGGGGVAGRIGNGFDLYGWGSQILVEGCRFWEIYDVALAIEAVSGSSSDVIFRNNVAWNCNVGMEINADGGAADVAGVYCVNNTFAYMGYQQMANQRPQQSWSNAGGFFFHNDGGNPFTSIYVYNNIVYESKFACFYDGPDFDLNPVALDYNLYYQGDRLEQVASQAGNGWPHDGYHYMMPGYAPYDNKILFFPNWYNDTGKDQHTIVADPQFVDAANYDFRLRSTSPAIDAGKMLGVPTDFAGIPRPQGAAIDIGAFESTIPKVVNSQINGGAVQRSKVTSLTITFSQIVSLDAGAFSVLMKGAGGGLVNYSVSTVIVNNRTIATLTFSGTRSEFGSLKDGDYTLTIDATKVHNAAAGTNLDGDRNGLSGGNYQFGAAAADRFFRLYGDSDGDRDVDNIDFARFRTTIGMSAPVAGFLAYFDFDGDGDVDNLDFARFRLRMASTMPFIP
jgi:hypothetical protein